MLHSMTTPDTGIHSGIPMDAYLAIPYPSSHTLSKAYLSDGTFSPAHMRAAIESNGETTPAMSLGTAAHSLLLEPADMLSRYVVMPPFEDQVRTKAGKIPANPKATNEYRRLVAEFTEANAGKIVIPSTDLAKLQAMSAAVHRHPQARTLLRQIEDVEITLVWDDQETGVRCKRRPDAKGVEIKTTEQIDRFRWTFARFGYDLQCAMEQDGWLALTSEEIPIHMIVVESVPPHSVICAPVSRATIDHGRERYMRALHSWQEGVETGNWPGPESPTEFTLPGSSGSDNPKPKFGNNVKSKEAKEWD